MVVHVVGLFFNVVVVVAYLVFWVLPALVVGMLAVDAMQMAQLLKLTVLERSLAILVILAILAGVPVAGMVSFEATTIAKKSRPADTLALILTACITLLTLCQPLKLVPVMLFQLVTKLVFGGGAKLFIMFSLDQAIAELSKKNTLEVLGKSLYCLVPKLTPTADILRAVGVMKGHVEPLHLQCGVGLGDISLREKLCDTKHLFKMMEMVQRACKELFMDAMVSARCQVDVLVIPGFFLFRVQVKKRSIACKKFSAKAQSWAGLTTSVLTGTGKCSWSTCFQLAWYIQGAHC
jgi:hypothetical protein